MIAKMQCIEDPSQILTVYEYYMTSNYWEFYVLDDNADSDIRYCLVMGFEQELGDVSIAEIKPFVYFHTKRLGDLLPASGFKWMIEASKQNVKTKKGRRYEKK